MQRFYVKIFIKLSFACAAIVWFLLTLRRIFVNVHIDEELMVAMGYRVARGDVFFTDIQEPQLLLAPFLGIIEKIWIIFHGSTEGIFVYMKICTAVILLAVSFAIYCVLKDFFNE